VNATYLTEENIQSFIRAALAEDIGEGDHSTLGAVPVYLQSEARLLVKEEGILAGITLAWKIFQAVDPALVVDVKMGDGQAVRKGDVAFIVSGKARSMLTAERLVLNCMQRMSGIATYTHQ
jgi:nicotinate-nucleotide pyrophosphorylase (carboxylating)